MITTPLLENSVNLIIPSSGAANAPVNSAQVQTISIDRRETIKINDKPVAESELVGAPGGIEARESRSGHRDSPGPRFAGAEIDRADGCVAARANQQSRHRNESGNEIAMSRDASFWRNVALIALAHLAVVLALARASRDPQKPNVPSVVWMNNAAPETAAATPLPPAAESEPERETTPPDREKQDEPR